MRPHTICHMMSSLDGRIDPDALQPIAPDDEFERTGDELGGDAWLCGRTTLQKDFSDYLGPEPFPAGPPAGPQPPHLADPGATSFAIAADTHGQILWRTAEIDGDHIIALVSEQASARYLAALRERGVSYLVCGETELDLQRALDLLAEHFPIRTLLLEGGGHINGAFLAAGLVDELSLVLVPALDGRADTPSIVNRPAAPPATVTPMTLTSVTRRDRDILWLRYRRA